MRKKLLLFLTVFIIQTFYLQAEPLALSDSVKAYMLSYSTGDDLYTFFGHSAIRIEDPVNKFDKIYNYGTFDFNTPNFYIKFVRGQLMYKLSREEFSSEIESWAYMNRSVFMQKINISSDEIRTLYKNLEINYLQENRYYKYDLFFDNCATRVRDIIAVSLSKPIIYNYENLKDDESFRTLLHPFVLDKSWLMLGMDLILGYPTDVKAKPYEYMYLPNHLMTVFSDSKIQNDTNTINLLEQPMLLYKREPIKKKESFPNAWQFFWILFGLVAIISLYEFIKKDYFKGLDVTVFGFTGFIGLFLLFLWFGTEHVSLEKNMNLLWAVPTNLIFAYLILKNKKAKWHRYYLIVLLVLLIILMLLSDNKFPAIYPLVLIIALRSLIVYMPYSSVKKMS